MKKIPVGKIRLATIDQGEGTPVVLLHGFPLDHTMWDAQIEGLSDQFRRIAPDLRGFGQSDPTDHLVTMEQFADDVAELLDALHVTEPVVVCGLSMGGYVAWQFWRRHRSRLAGLILCDTRAVADTPEVAAARLETADQVEAKGSEILYESMIKKLLAESTGVNRPEVGESIRQMIRSANRRGVAAAARGMAERPDVTDWLPRIDCPTLLIVGRHDKISPVSEMRSIAKAIPNAHFCEIPDAGHMSPMENPEAVNQSIDHFVRRIS